MSPRRAWFALLPLLFISKLPAADGNRLGDRLGDRLTYLDAGVDPYYVHQKFPKLITPQWVGEEGVEAVVILAIDDMRDHKPYESYLRPILERLKKIDGRAPVSIMTCQINPDEPHLQKWLKEGVSLECHTFDHPCPLLRDGDFAKAKATYDRCVDLMFSIPNSKPVAFRTPCCDSLNTNSPRMYAEIFNRVSDASQKRPGQANFLQIDSSVFNVFTSNDPDLPRELVQDPDGRDRFLKYLPRDRSFVNTIENYPYPYVIGRLCWQFPCMTPSDWQAQHLHKPNNPVTIRDWQAALDCTVLKQGVFCLVFHPHGWIKPEQVIELIDHAQAKHGKKVKFLTFKEGLERLNKNLLGGQALRDAKGQDNGVRLLDLNNDGFMDVVIGNERLRQSRVWLPKARSWQSGGFPVQIVASNNSGDRMDLGVRFGILWSNGNASFIIRNGKTSEAYHFDGAGIGKLQLWWLEDKALFAGLDRDHIPVKTSYYGEDSGFRLIDIDHDGTCEAILGHALYPTGYEGTDPEGGRVAIQAAFKWTAEKKAWQRLAFSLPPKLVIADGGRDQGLRFLDLNEDGYDDIIFSNEKAYGIYLFESMEQGWKKVREGKQGDKDAIPPITVKGTNNGFFVHSRTLWWQNEHTNLLKDHVDRRSFNELLKDVEPGPKSPEASLACIKTRPGFTVELVAAEPLVQDPIAFAWGPDGKFWVVEMGDYPSGVPEKTPSPPTPLPQGGEGRKNQNPSPPLGERGRGEGVLRPGSGRVKFLEDTDGDGKYDKATVFLDGLSFATGVMPWRKGILVTCAPDILYAEDTDGDGKADKREVLFTGFVEGNPQHRVNTLAWGLDNWIYGANGDSGGKITGKPLSPNPSLRSGERGTEPSPLSPLRGEGSGERGVSISGRDFRIRPDSGQIEPVTGMTQFGRGRDDWNNWFGGNNANPLWHFALEDRYLRRNPHFAPPDPRVNVPAVPGTAPVFPLSRTLPRFNDFHTANRFTSACSPIVYRDELFVDRSLREREPGSRSEPTTMVFISEPVHNLVHREVMVADGVTFKSRRAADEQQSEFLASSDNWFRPAMIQTGPDGALWIADMYRLVIEHPQWIPVEWQKKLDLRAGHDKGRIYRVYPVGKKPRAIPRLDKLDTAGLVAALDSPNGWQRDMAQMMLIWQRDKAATPLLEKLIAETNRPVARLHALCTLDGLAALKPSVLLKALGDSQPGVRRHAIRLCEGAKGLRIPNERLPEFAEALLKLVDDPDAPVRMQLAYTLGQWDDPRAGEALGKLAVKDAHDRYLFAAVMSSINAGNLDHVLVTALASGGRKPAESAGPKLLEALLRQANLQGNTKAVARLLAAVAQPDQEKYAAWQFATLAGLLDTLDQRGSSLARLHQEGDADLKASIQKLTGLFAAARKLVANSDSSTPARLQAIELLGRGLDQQQADVKLLTDFLTPQSAGELQSAAVTQLGRLRDPKVADVLLRGWKAYVPGLRNQVLDVLLRRDDWLRPLLDAVENKQVLAFEIDIARRARLLQHSNEAIRSRAERLFAGGVQTDRQKVVEEYRAALKLRGDVPRGQALFTKHCANCHRLGETGNAVGPDLAALTDRSPEALLVAVLDPNRALEAPYVNYVAATKNNLILTGVLARETGSSVTLVGLDGKPQTILRADLDSLASTGKSVMPEGLEKELSPQDLADLIAHVSAAVPPAKRKVFEGNKPEIVHGLPDGSIRLAATNCEIFGKTLVFEKEHTNLGYWSSEDDHAVWTVEIPKGGRYAVSLDYACADSTAGNLFILEVGDQRLAGKVAGTGAWENYRQMKLGELTLAAGRQRFVFRSAGKINGALIDLRTIHLRAVGGR